MNVNIIILFTCLLWLFHQSSIHFFLFYMQDGDGDGGLFFCIILCFVCVYICYSAAKTSHDCQSVRLRTCDVFPAISAGGLKTAEYVFYSFWGLLPIRNCFLLWHVTTNLHDDLNNKSFELSWVESFNKFELTSRFRERIDW